jgi:hypothetical protein
MTSRTLNSAFGLFVGSLGLGLSVAGGSANVFFNRTGDFFDAASNTVFIHLPFPRFS